MRSGALRAEASKWAIAHFFYWQRSAGSNQQSACRRPLEAECRTLTPDCFQGLPTMNGADVLRVVDLMHREKNIPKDVIFEGIEAALQLATEKHYGDEEDIAISIDRDSGEIHAQKGEQVIDPA